MLQSLHLVIITLIILWVTMIYTMRAFVDVDIRGFYSLLASIPFFFTTILVIEALLKV
jgi:uncharacterized membrane protein YhaH (DUF805 family)